MKDDGGQAFPRTGYTSQISAQKGMSLRDYFAAAEQTLPFDDWVAEYFNTRFINCWGDLTPTQKKEALSTWRFEMADAMIKARQSE